MASPGPFLKQCLKTAFRTPTRPDSDYVSLLLVLILSIKKTKMCTLMSEEKKLTTTKTTLTYSFVFYLLICSQIEHYKAVRAPEEMKREVEMKLYL